MSRKPKKISTLLNDAAKWIEEHGWAQHVFFKYRNGRPLDYSTSLYEVLPLAREKGCKACALGALYLVDGPDLESMDRDRRHDEATRYVEKVMGGWEGVAKGVASWNDSADRTKDEVVQALKEAAKAARKDGK